MESQTPSTLAHNNAIAGVVLAGGLSSRMGQDKAYMHVHGPLAPSLLDQTFTLLATVTSPTWVACRKNTPRPGYPCIFDAGTGPVHALYTALCHTQKAGKSALLALACDMPFMDAKTLTLLINTHGTTTAHVTTFVHEDTGQREPLASIYSVHALPFFAHAKGVSTLGLHSIVPLQYVHCIPTTPALKKRLCNCNTQEDIQQALLI